MTPEERDKADARARRMAAREEKHPFMSGGWMTALPVLFPDPDTTGMTPPEAQAAWLAWQTAVNDFIQHFSPGHPFRVTVPHAADSSQAQAS